MPLDERASEELSEVSSTAYMVATVSLCLSVLEISMRDAGMCDARIKGGHTLRYLEARRQKETVAFSYNELVPT